MEEPVVEEHEAEPGEEGDVVHDDAREAVPLCVVDEVVVARVKPGGDQGGVLEEAEGVVEQILVPEGMMKWERWKGSAVQINVHNNTSTASVLSSS